MIQAFSPVDASTLPERLADLAGPSRVRMAIDGPPCAAPELLAESLLGPLRMRGRDAAHVRAERFWHDASLRLEHGREDVESYLGWLDAPALRREVLDPFAADGRYLPSLRDPVTNRSTHEAPRSTGPHGVLVVSGSLLLGLGLPFDLTVHLDVSPAARARRTPAPEAWTLPAYEAYDNDVQPREHADVVLRWDDPRHPAAAGL